jgi:hypothetical protein
MTWGVVLFGAYCAYDREEVLAGSNAQAGIAAIVNEVCWFVDGTRKFVDGRG